VILPLHDLRRDLLPGERSRSNLSGLVSRKAIGHDKIGRKIFFEEADLLGFKQGWRVGAAGRSASGACRGSKACPSPLGRPVPFVDSGSGWRYCGPRGSV